MGKGKLDKVFDIIKRVCIYGIILCVATVLYFKTYGVGAYGASTMVIILAGFVFFIVTLNYRGSRR